MYINKVFLYGNLGRDPELRSLPSGTKVASFSVATTRTYKDKDGNKQAQTDWHNVVMFGRLAEVAAQYLKKGRPVFVEGRIQTRSWEDNSGNKQYRTEIVADNFQFGPSSAGGSTDSAQAMPEDQSVAPDEMPQVEQEGEISPDDIPF